MNKILDSTVRGPTKFIFSIINKTLLIWSHSLLKDAEQLDL